MILIHLMYIYLYFCVLDLEFTGHGGRRLDIDVSSPGRDREVLD